MKHKLIVLLLSFCFVLSAQNIRITSQYEIPLKNVKSAHYPTLNKDGDLLLYSAESYKGLYLYYFRSGEEKMISHDQNSGYYPIFSSDNSNVFFRKTTFEQGRRYDALESYNLKTEKQVQMIKPQRDLRAARSYHNGAIVQADNKLYKTTFGRTKAAIPVYVSAENLKIYVYVDGRRTEIQPLKGENINYIWISLSPDNSRILFTAAGKGTYICDLKGNVVASLGYLNAPVWFNDRFVVGMQDKDNGQNVTSSDVVMLTADGKLKKQISNPNHIAMYPAASSKANRIVYSTLDGKLVVSELSVN